MLIHELFLSTAQRQPDAVALACGAHALSYGALEALSEQLAAALAQRLPRGARVALNMHKSPEAIVLMLACLRASLGYVPLDPAAPLARRRLMLRDCAASALLLDARCAAEWESEAEALSELALLVAPSASAGVQVPWLRLSELARSGAAALAAGARLPSPSEDDLAYILYTSGSTGTPKGVMISQRNAAAFVKWAASAFDVGPGDRVALHAPLHFDLPIFDIYLSLANGARVCVLDERSVLFPEALLRFLRTQRITVLYAVPSALTALVLRSTLERERLRELRLLLYAGEAFHPAPLGRLMAALPSAAVYNLYGPIETNVVSYCRVEAADVARGRITIGQALAGTRLWVLDEAGQAIAGVGQAGELVVSGPSVSPGYLNRPELTAERFVPNPFLKNAGGGMKDEEGGLGLAPCSLRLYKTGDEAAWDERGRLMLLGRRDAMVKTRGYRVELGEVEASIAAHAAVAEVGVVGVAHAQYTTVLHAYVVVQAGAQLSERELLSWCRERMVGYMVPTRVTLCEELPKTSTGKLARRELARQASQSEGRAGAEG